MPFSKLEHLLDAKHVRYTRIRHSPAYTAQEIAAAAHVPGRELAKTEEDRAVMTFLSADVPIARSYVTNPGVPAERVQRWKLLRVHGGLRVCVGRALLPRALRRG